MQIGIGIGIPFARGVGFHVASLFSNGEVGTWFDPSDVSLNWRRNLLTYTEEFDNAVWVKQNATVTANSVVSPDGNTTADTLTRVLTTASESSLRFTTAQQVSTTYTMSVYAKAGTVGNLLYVRNIATGASLADGTVAFALDGSNTITGGAAYTNKTITPVGNGWYRCSFTSTTGASIANNLLDIGVTSSSTVGGTAGDFLYIWGAQLEQSPTATDYQRIVTPEITYVADVQPQPILYQDAAGTTPVTAVEQPVGLMLDKSEGLVIGPTVATGNWLNGYSTAFDTFTSLSDDGFTATTSSAKTGIRIIVPCTFQANKTYQIEFTLTTENLTVASVWFSTSVYSGYTLIQSPATISSGVLYKVVGRPPVDLTHFMLIINTTGSASATLTGFTAKEISGNHAYQTTSTARPTLKAKYNLLNISTFVSTPGSAWQVDSITTTLAQPDVDLSNTAVLIDEGTDTASHQYRTSVGNTFATPANTDFTIKVKVKDVDTQYIAIAVYGAYNNYRIVEFDLTSGTVNRNAGANVTLVSSSITDIENEWKLCEITYNTADTTSKSFRIGFSDGISSLVSLTGNLPSITGTERKFYMCHPDARISNDGISIPSYQRVTTTTDYDTVGFKPYLQFDGTDDFMVTNSINFSTVTSDGQTRRNLLTYPSAFDNSAWGKGNVTVSANSTIAPDGTTTADLITGDAGTSSKIITQPEVISPDHTLSVYVKANGHSFIQLNNPSSGGAYINFDIENGTVGTNGVYVSDSSITNEGNDWFRCSATFTLATTAIGISLVDSDSATYRQASATTDSVYLWGAQLEEGSSATDFQDIGTDKMTVFAGVRKLSDAGDQIIYEFSATIGTNNGSFVSSVGNGLQNFAYYSRGTSIAGSYAIGIVAPTTAILSQQGNIASDIASMRINGVFKFNDTRDQGSGNYGNYPLYIGSRAGTSLRFNGRLYGLIVRGAQSTDAEITNTETWMNNKTKAY